MANFKTSSSGKPANNTVLTPKWIFDELGIVFDLDVAHPPFDTNVPCLRWYTEQNDGLTSEWTGTVWMNPPYSKPGPWVDKWLEHGDGLCLVAVSKASWWNRLWESNALCYVLPASFKFEEIDGKPKSIWGMSSIWALGEKSTLALTRLANGKGLR